MFRFFISHSILSQTLTYLEDRLICTLLQDLEQFGFKLSCQFCTCVMKNVPYSDQHRLLAVLLFRFVNRIHPRHVNLHRKAHSP